MKQEEFYKGIRLSEEAIQVARRYQVSQEEQTEYWELFQTDRESFYELMQEKKERRQLFLALYLQFAFSLQEEYAKRKISETIFLDTFSDISIWASNCQRDYGEIGLEEYQWLTTHLDLRLFRLGRLQFELMEGSDGFTYNKRTLSMGEKALNLHIPQGEPLSIEGCLDSINKAAAFFEGIKEITCHSWLLSPILAEILGAQSNIVKFQKLFEIYALDQDSREAEERVFQKNILEDPSGYAENTTLQRKLKDYLVKGKKPGSAFGLYCNPISEDQKLTPQIQP